MPLTEKGREILAKLTREYGSAKKAKEVLYAGKNKGTFTGIDKAPVEASAVQCGGAIKGNDMRARLRRAFDALLNRHLTK